MIRVRGRPFRRPVAGRGQEPNPRFEDVGSTVTIDVGARRQVDTLPGKAELYVNIANLPNRHPLLLPSSALGGAQTNVALHDTIGHFVMAGFRVQC